MVATRPLRVAQVLVVTKQPFMGIKSTVAMNRTAIIVVGNGDTISKSTCKTSILDMMVCSHKWKVKMIES